MRPRKLVLVWPLLAHAAAWAAFLWLVFWPFAYRGVSVQAVPPGKRCRACGDGAFSFLDRDQWTMGSAPSIGTGGIDRSRVPGSLELDSRKWTRSAILWVLAVLTLGFCALGILSIGAFYLPAALALLTTAIVSIFQVQRPSAPGGQTVGSEI